MKRFASFLMLLSSLSVGCATSTRATLPGATQATSDPLHSRELIVADVRPVEPVVAAPAEPATQPIPTDDSLPIPLVEVRGTPADMGREHGSALREQIQTLKTRYLDVRLANSTTLKLLAYTGTALFEAKMSNEHHDEIVAMADASGLDRRTAMLAHCFLDMSETVACSTVSFPAQASPDGVARMGRNLDFPGLKILDSMSAVLIYHPTDGRYQFAAITWPGLAGVLSGMNEHGLVLCNMEVTRSPRFPTAMPYVLLYRTVLERCRDVDEAIDLLQNTPRQSRNNLMLMDAAGHRAVVEITPDSIEVRRGTDDAALISTNHQRGQDTETEGRCRRYDYLHATSAQEFGSIGVEQIEHMLAGAAQGKWSLQSMVFEPSNRVMYLATGSIAPTKKFYRIDLKQHFDPSIEQQ